MATNIVQMLKQQHCILNGVSLFGEVDEINIPDISLMTEEIIPNTDTALDVETGMEKLDVELKVRGIQSEVSRAIGGGNPNTRLEVRGALEDYEGLGSEVLATWEFVGLAKILSTDPLQGRSELPMTTLTINANYYKHVIDGEEIHEIDVLNNIRIIDGVDRLERIRDLLEI